jgi:CBS domain-containing protein
LGIPTKKSFGKEVASMSIESLLRRSVQTLPPDAPCREAARLLRDEGVGCVVVSEEGRLEGVVALDDLLPLLAQQLGELAEAIRGELETP